jgi:hypothetical protein
MLMPALRQAATIVTRSTPQCEIERKISDTPAEGPVGLAIKLCLSLHADHYACRLDAETGGA